MKQKSIKHRIISGGIIALAALILMITALPVITTANEPLIFVDFEDGTISGFDVRGTEAERERGTGVLTVSTDVARSGTHSLLITERQLAWNGIAFDLLPYIEPNVSYRFTFWVHAKTPDASEFILSTQIGQGPGASYLNLQSRNVNVTNGWVEMTESHTYTERDIDTGHITVYIENNNADAEFYVDDFTVAVRSGFSAWDPLTDPITANRRGTFEDVDFEFWSENPDQARMQLTGPGTFWCNWTDARNVLFRTGKKLGSVMAYEQYGDITIDYKASHSISSGNVSYLTAYGWTEDPLMEWYVIEKHGSYKPPGGGGTLHGTVGIDGGTYEVWTDMRIDKPSIQGEQTFLQIFSIRTEHRTEGIITMSDHFKAWEEFGLDVSGNLYEVSMCIEGFGSSGNGSISRHILTIGDEVYGGVAFDLTPDTDPEPGTTPAPDPTPAPAPDPEPGTTPVPTEDPGDTGFPVWGIILIIFGGIAAVGIAAYTIIKKKN